MFSNLICFVFIWNHWNICCKKHLLMWIIHFCTFVDYCIFPTFYAYLLTWFWLFLLNLVMLKIFLIMVPCRSFIYVILDSATLPTCCCSEKTYIWHDISWCLTVCAISEQLIILVMLRKLVGWQLAGKQFVVSHHVAGDEGLGEPRGWYMYAHLHLCAD